MQWPQAPRPRQAASWSAGLVAIALGFGVYRRLTRGERGQESTVEGFAAQI